MRLVTISRMAARSSNPSFFANSSSSAGTTARLSVCAVTSKFAALPATVGTPYSAGKVTSIVRVSPGFMPSSGSLKPGMKPVPPISTSISLPVPPGNSVPSIRPT